MKLASLAFGVGALIATTLSSAAPASAGDDAFVGVQVGPLRVGADFDDGYRRYHHRHHYDDRYYRDRYRDWYDGY